MSPSDWSIFTNNLMDRAYCDLVYLLDQGYPKKSALSFVGNHYTLDINQRNVLYRVAIPMKDVRAIQAHLIRDSSVLSEKDFYIDTYNQFITFFSLINHDPVIICRDGVLRDIYKSIHVDKDLKITSDLISQYLTVLLKLNPNKVNFFLDAKASLITFKRSPWSGYKNNISIARIDMTMTGTVIKMRKPIATVLGWTSNAES